MLVVPGTKVQINLFAFHNEHPPLYYAANTGSLNLASLNAGNSQQLYVGGGGVNLAFDTAQLTPAGQKTDDYQNRHQQLLAKAKGTPLFEKYDDTNPTVFSYLNPKQVGTTSGWLDGICFIDVFDSSLCPKGNVKNMAMVYTAPPYGDNYASNAEFLTAVEATARIVIETIAGYNAIAPQQGMPLIESLRSTVFSSAIYNRKDKVTQKPLVDPGDVAKTIYQGYAAELAKQPNCGLLELEFPCGKAGQDQGFTALESLFPSASGKGNQ